MRQDQWITVQHPWKVDSIIDLLGKLRDFRVLGKISRRRQGPAKKERSVHRRNFAIPFALAIRHLHPVIKPAVLMEGSIGEELQSSSNALSSLVARNPPVFGSDADRSQSKSGRCQTRDIAARALGASAGLIGPIQHQSCCRIGLLPKIKNAAVF